METEVCRECKQEVVKVWGGKRKYDNTRIYVNTEGCSWNGRLCPPCNAAHTKLTRESYKNTHDKSKTHRKCRICNAALGAKSYFHCTACLEVLNGTEDMLSQYEFHLGVS